MNLFPISDFSTSINRLDVRGHYFPPWLKIVSVEINKNINPIHIQDIISITKYWMQFCITLVIFARRTLKIEVLPQVNDVPINLKTSHKEDIDMKNDPRDFL